MKRSKTFQNTFNILIGIRLIESVFFFESWIGTGYFLCKRNQNLWHFSYGFPQTEVRGILSKEIEVLVSSLSMIFLIQ